MESDPMESHRKRARELLGLRSFPERDAEEVRRLLGSDMRTKAHSLIDTTTHPRSKREVKKGIVLELIAQDLWPLDVARTYPLVYVGSGTDIEYPLALGARRIVMVDPLFAHAESVQEIIQRIRTIGVQDIQIAESRLSFLFEFQQGIPEEVSVIFDARSYEEERLGSFEIPDEVGAIVTYAPSGVHVGEPVTAHLVSGGIRLHEFELERKEKDASLTHRVFGE